MTPTFAGSSIVVTSTPTTEAAGHSGVLPPGLEKLGERAARHRLGVADQPRREIVGDVLRQRDRRGGAKAGRCDRFRFLVQADRERRLERVRARLFIARAACFFQRQPVFFDPERHRRGADSDRAFELRRHAAGAGRFDPVELTRMRLGFFYDHTDAHVERVERRHHVLIGADGDRGFFGAVVFKRAFPRRAASNAFGQIDFRGDRPQPRREIVGELHFFAIGGGVTEVRRHHGDRAVGLGENRRGDLFDRDRTVELENETVRFFVEHFHRLSRQRALERHGVGRAHHFFAFQHPDGAARHRDVSSTIHRFTCTFFECFLHFFRGSVVVEERFSLILGIFDRDFPGRSVRDRDRVHLIRPGVRARFVMEIGRAGAGGEVPPRFTRGAFDFGGGRARDDTQRYQRNEAS